MFHAKETLNIYKANDLHVKTMVNLSRKKCITPQIKNQNFHPVRLSTKELSTW